MEKLWNRLRHCTKNTSDPIEDDRFSKIWSLLSLSGFWTIKHDWKYNGRPLVLSIFMFVFYINDLKNFTARLIGGVFEIPNDVEIMTFIQTQGITMYRIYLLVRHRKSLRRLMRYINEEFSSWIGCPKMKNKIRNNCKKGSWIFISQALQLITTGSMLFIRPLLSSEPNALVMQHPLGRFPLIPADRFPFYQITYFLQVLNTAIEVSLAFSTDMLFFLLSINLCAYLEWLPTEIETMEEGEDLQEMRSLILNTFVDRYNVAKEFIDLLNDCFSKFLCILPIYTGFSIITSLLVFNGKRETLSFLGIAVAHTLELYVYCYAGDLIKEKSLKLASKIYASRWYNFSHMDKKKILQILQHYNRPLTIKSGLFGTLNRYTFTNTMKTTYSIWTVINQTNGKSNIY